uniref:Histone H4 n=1 Tax=Musca domestica TaxID=7370 RepID=A0A1I8N427_MUSDO
MTGRGKGGKGLGKGGAKRHRKVLRDNIQGITKPAIRRLARRGGVKRISGLIYEETRGVLKVFLENHHNAVLFSCMRRFISTKTLLCRQNSLANHLLYAFSPKNAPGCDYLKFLSTTIYKFCIAWRLGYMSLCLTFIATTRVFKTSGQKVKKCTINCSETPQQVEIRRGEKKIIRKMCDQERSLNNSTLLTDDGATTDGYQTVDSRKQKKRKKRNYCDCEDISYLKLKFDAKLSGMKAQIEKMQAKLDKALKEKAELEEKFKNFSNNMMETETTTDFNMDFPPLTNNKGPNKTSASIKLPAINQTTHTTAVVDSGSQGPGTSTCLPAELKNNFINTMTNKVINSMTNKVINCNDVNKVINSNDTNKTIKRNDANKVINPRKRTFSENNARAEANTARAQQSAKQAGKNQPAITVYDATVVEMTNILDIH